ncbi:hypothetical protein [Undibacterium sp. WLX3042]|uniref:hypothetical protein n=1 Tax=Undibacterium sp. WLX3042 TaxID=3412686 RepID=UPI003C2BAF8B
MPTPPSQAEQWLSDAQAAVTRQEPAFALEKYLQFFEHALEENPALSAVRLSFCLSGWADLARNYPPAQLKLKQHCEQSLQQFMATGLTSDFHDYLSICRCLNTSDAALDTFCRIHETHPALAASVHDLIWVQLAEAKKWSICARYLDDYQKKYELALEVYLGSMSIAQKHPDTGDEFITICQQRFADHIRHLISALEHTGRQQQASDICGLANQAVITHQIPLELFTCAGGSQQ